MSPSRRNPTEPPGDSGAIDVAVAKRTLLRRVTQVLEGTAEPPPPPAENVFEHPAVDPEARQIFASLALEVVQIAAKRSVSFPRGLVGDVLHKRLKIPIAEYCKVAGKDENKPLHPTTFNKARDHRELILQMTDDEIEREGWEAFARICALILGEEYTSFYAKLVRICKHLGILIPRSER